MDRMTLKEEIRQHFDCRDYLRKSSGCSLYICPSCGSGSRQHKTGAVQYYPDTQRWYCHKCRTLGDIFTLYELEHGVNFNTALRALAEQLGTSVEPHSTKPASKLAHSSRICRTESGFENQRTIKNRPFFWK